MYLRVRAAIEQTRRQEPIYIQNREFYKTMIFTFNQKHEFCISKWWKEEQDNNDNINDNNENKFDLRMPYSAVGANPTDTHSAGAKKISLEKG